MRRLLLIAALGACAGSSDEPTEGDATLTFSVTNGVRENPTLEDPLIGAIYGNLFLTEEVTITGPVDGAVELGSVELTGVDLEAATETEAWQTPLLAEGSYTFLGFFDVDGNGGESYQPDPGDPVTLPVTNVFEVRAGETTELAAMFDLVLN
jgi:hypothetical protein